MVPAARGYLRPVGEWNYQEVTVRMRRSRSNSTATVILDGDLARCTEYMGGKPHPGKDRKRGHFGFAGHNDPVQYRAITVRPLQGE